MLDADWGAWLSVFKEYGIEDILGIDSACIDKSLVEIPAEKFIPQDLTKPVNINRTFDLAVCLEVVEHISP